METALTSLFGLQQPIVLAPMGSIAGGRLAAAVSNAGGLGLVGGGYGDAQWLATELSLARQGTMCAWGVGFITWSVHRSVVELALGYGPDAVMLSFGDPAPYARMIKASGAAHICQVQDLEEAQRAVDAGADVIVAQGTEGGGHGGRRSTFSLVPAVVDAVAPIPVVAAGGIADGRGLAAALMLGAQGVLVGTRFYAAHESLGRPEAKQRICRARGDETARTRAFDVVRGLAWPEKYPGRALRNAFMDRWHGHESELAAAGAGERQRYQSAARERDFDTAVVWAGEAVDLINEVEGAAAIVQRIVSDAEDRLRKAAG
jgi:nitronate monooxygenase